jgi:hypothetical protein
MQTSVFLAKLIGPVMLAAAVGLLVNQSGQRAMAREFLASTPLIYFTGALAMIAGVAILLYHNVWALDWRVIITLFGWAAAIGGAVRMVMPDFTRTVGEAFMDKPWMTLVGGIFWLVIAAVLCFYGYFA